MGIFMSEFKQISLEGRTSFSRGGTDECYQMAPDMIL